MCFCLLVWVSWNMGTGLCLARCRPSIDVLSECYVYPVVSSPSAFFKCLSGNLSCCLISSYSASKSLKHTTAVVHLLMQSPSHCQNVTHAFPDRWPFNLYLNISSSLWGSFFYGWTASSAKFFFALLWSWSFHSLNPSSLNIEYFCTNTVWLDHDTASDTRR